MQDSFKTQYRYVALTIKELRASPLYVTLMIAVSCMVLSLLILLPNYPFLRITFISDYFSFSEKIWLLITSFGAFETNFTRFSQVTTVLAALLIGLQVSLLVLYVKKRIRMQKSIGVSAFGTIVSILGVGCTACGSVILSSIFGVGAVTSTLGLLPFGGKEITLLGLIILSASVWYTAYKQSAPVTCYVTK